VSINNAQLPGVQGARGIGNMGKQGFSGKRMKNLGQSGLHSLAHTGSEYDDVHKRRLPVMQNSNMRVFRLFGRLLSLFAAVCILSSCSLARFGYSYIEKIS
jgi:hypothetical protein